YIDTGEPSNPPTRHIRVRYGVLEGGRMRVDFPEARVDAKGISMNLSDFLLQNIDDVTFLIPHVHTDSVDLHMRPYFRPFPSLDRLTAPIRNMDVRRFEFALNHFKAHRMTADIDGGTMEATMAMDFVLGQTPLWKGDAKVHLPATSTILPELFDDFASGAFSMDLLGHGSLDEFNLAVVGRSPRMEIGGHVVDNAVMRASAEPRITPEGRINHPMMIEQLTGDVFGGKMDVGPFRYVLRWARPAPANADGIPTPGYGTRHAFGGRVGFEGVDPWTLLDTLDLPFGLDVAPFLRGHATGVFHTEGFYDEETARFSVSATTEGIDMDWLRVAGWPLGNVVQVSGSLEASRGGVGASAPIGDVFEDHDTVVIEDMQVKSAGDVMVVRDAKVDLKRESMEAEGDLRIRDLRRFLSYFDVDTVAGRAHFSNVKVSGSIWDPSVDAIA
ncbi:MAG: hypothetical protein QF464_19685, partial [Myxococcota bacterium]|nr:hypothetical protein [Myxococcota bacterium]